MTSRHPNDALPTTKRSEMPRIEESLIKKWIRYDPGGIATERRWLRWRHIDPVTLPTLARRTDSCAEPFRSCSKQTSSEIATYAVVERKLRKKFSMRSEYNESTQVY